MFVFKAKIEIIGINPYVLVPEKILKQLFEQAGKNKGQISVKLRIAEVDFIQTLVRYSGQWRLYLNTPMRKASKTEVGEIIEIAIAFDNEERITPMHPKLEKALAANPEAKVVFETLSPSRQKEIKRLHQSLKKRSIDRRKCRRSHFIPAWKNAVCRS